MIACYVIRVGKRADADILDKSKKVQATDDFSRLLSKNSRKIMKIYIYAISNI